MSITARPADRVAPPDLGRALPCNPEAEQGLLGSMLLAPPAVLPLVEDQPPEIFYEPRHQTLFAVIVDLWRRGVPADIITLTQALRERGKLEAVGGPPYVTTLIDFTPTAANAGYYFEHLLEALALRRIALTCHDFAARACSRQADANVLRDEFEAAALAVNSGSRAQGGGDDPATATDAVVERLEAIYERRPGIVGIQTGWKPLDRMTGGMFDGQVIFVGARTSVGKSAFAANLAEHVALELKLPVGIQTLEMTALQYRQRMMLSRARINIERYREQLISEDDFRRLAQVTQEFRAAPLYVDDTRGLSIADFRARARRWHRERGLRLLIVDYVQKLRSTGRQAEDNRAREIGQVSNGLQVLAGELGIPIIVLAQLSRDAAKANRPPQLTDLRDSGELEQDADVVLLLHRPELQARNEEDRAELSGEADLIVAKQREGPLGDIKMTFRKEFCRFEERSQRSEATISRVADL